MTNMYMDKLYRITEWIMRLAYVNILWMFFSVIGLIIFGIFPATTSMFSVIRKWVNGEENFAVAKFFWGNYKKDFLKSNLLGFILTIIGYFLLIDFMLIRESPDQILQLLMLPILIISILYFLTILYVFPIFVQFELKISHILKNSFLIMVLNPFISLIMLLGVAMCFLLFYIVPSAIPFFGSSLTAAYLMWSSKLSFRKLNYKMAVSDQR